MFKAFRLQLYIDFHLSIKAFLLDFRDRNTHLQMQRVALVPRSLVALSYLRGTYFYLKKLVREEQELRLLLFITSITREIGRDAESFFQEAIANLIKYSGPIQTHLYLEILQYILFIIWNRGQLHEHCKLPQIEHVGDGDIICFSNSFKSHTDN
ncbi:hypothetical protein ACJX0J_031652 [Zea mays]